MFNTLSVKSSGEIIHRKLRKILEWVKEEDINVIGHSLGGVLSIEAVRVATGMRVNNVIAMASPVR